MALAVAFGLASAARAAADPRAPIVLAAASLQESLTAVADAWADLVRGRIDPAVGIIASL